MQLEVIDAADDLGEEGEEESGGGAARALRPAHMLFVPGDPPRTGKFALYAPPGEWWISGLGTGFYTTDMEIVWPVGTGVRRKRAPVGYLPFATGLAYLGGSPEPGAPQVSLDTALALAAAVQSGLTLIARGRLYPAVSPEGFDAWRAGPLDPADLRLVEDIAAAMPPAAHCLSLGADSPLRVMSPQAAVRAVWDALADSLVRTRAAAVVAGGEPPRAVSAPTRTPAPARTPRGKAAPARRSKTGAAPPAPAAPLFSAAAPQSALALAGWLAETGRGLQGGIRVGLRIALGTFGLAAPDLGDHGQLGERGEDDDEWDEDDDEWGEGEGPEQEGEEEAPHAIVQVASVADPSLIVDAADLFALPAAVLARMGEDADTELLLALRRGARAWSTMAPLLAERTPSRLELTDDDVEDLLTGGGADALAAAGIDILWPTNILLQGLTLRAELQAAPKVEGTSGFTLREILTFQWQVAIGDQELTDEELDQLAEAKRTIVRIHGRWVAVDPDVIARARDKRRRTLSAAEGLAALLAGELVVDGQTVGVVATGSIAAFVDRLRAIGDGTAAIAGPPPGFAGELRHYQERGVAWLQSMCELGLGGCLADDMGLGKTIQVIGLHLHRRDASAPGGTAIAAPAPAKRRASGKAKRRQEPAAATTLITCPTSLLGNWVREVQRFAPGVPVRRYYGPERTLEALQPGEMVVTTYGICRRDQEALAEARFSLVVADEAQHAKNPFSETARALRTVCADPAQVRVALTGTPVENRLSELWSILDWTTPGLLGPLERFQKTVATPVERRRDPQITERLQRTVRPFLMRRKKTDPAIAPDLPPRTVTDLPVGLTPEQVTLYEAEVREALEAISQKKGIQRQGLVFRMLTVLKQICNHPASYLHQHGPIAGRSGKLAALEELLPVIVDEGDSVLVFSQYVEMCTILQARLAELGIDTLFLHGQVPAKKREELVAAFQAGRAPVFLLSLKAGGVGLNLTRATHVVHYDRWWNPAVEDQATDRAHRIGQDRPVQVHRLIAEGTLEDRIAALLETKRDLAEKVVGEGEAWIAHMSDDELADLVQLAKPDR